MKEKKSKQPDRMKLSVPIGRHLKRRIDEAARQEGIAVKTWVLRTIEAKLAAHGAHEGESFEYEQEQKLDDIRAMRDTW